MYVIYIYNYYLYHEHSKRKEYQQRINEMDGGSFTPLVFSTSGGMRKSALTFQRRLAHRVVIMYTGSLEI